MCQKIKKQLPNQLKWARYVKRIVVLVSDQLEFGESVLFFSSHI